MASSFEEASAYLDSLGIDVMKTMAPSLHRVEAMLEALDHPERSVPAIHVTGTNGKTSVTRIAASILSAAGLSTGAFTSPHLESVRERIALGGEPIGVEDFGALFAYLRPYLEQVQKDLGEHLTYFEVLTSMFFVWAAETPLNAMVVEVGLGGRWDATNVLDASVAVITNVGLDHTGLLGTERTTIAREKSGIVKPGSAVVTGERSPDVLAVITEVAHEGGAEVSCLERDFGVTDSSVAVGGRQVSLRTGARTYEQVFLPLHGSHQAVNAAIAVEAVSRFIPGRTLDDEVVAQGLAKSFVPGRLEVVRAGTETMPTIVLDVAHNPDGVSMLVRGLVETFTFERVVFVLGILADKDHVGMLRELARLPCSLIVTEPRNARAVPAHGLKVSAGEMGIECEAVDDASKAVDVAVHRAEPGDLVCITGSHYLVGEVRSQLVGR